MEAAGLNSFRPLMEFEESFCQSPEQVSLHRQYMIELAKERLGNAPPYPFLRDTWVGGYRSPFLDHLRELRAQAGNSFESYDRSKRWLIELSPCKFNETELRYTQSAEHRRRKAPYLERRRELRLGEIARYSSGMSAQFGLGKKGRLRLARAVIEECLPPGEFKYDSWRATSSLLVFSKELSPKVSLCWLLDGNQLLKPIGIRPEDQIGYLDIALVLESRKIKGRPRDPAREHWLVISYNYAAPIDGLECEYGRFESLSELETLIRAHLFVYCSMAQSIEGCLSEGLEALSTGDACGAN
jgi:hypothetical protein